MLFLAKGNFFHALIESEMSYFCRSRLISKYSVYNVILPPTTPKFRSNRPSYFVFSKQYGSVVILIKRHISVHAQ